MKKKLFVVELRRQELDAASTFLDSGWNNFVDGEGGRLIPTARISGMQLSLFNLPTPSTFTLVLRFL